MTYNYVSEEIPSGFTLAPHQNILSINMREFLTAPSILYTMVGLVVWLFRAHQIYIYVVFKYAKEETAS